MEIKPEVLDLDIKRILLTQLYQTKLIKINKELNPNNPHMRYNIDPAFINNYQA